MLSGNSHDVRSAIGRQSGGWIARTSCALLKPASRPCIRRVRGRSLASVRDPGALDPCCQAGRKRRECARHITAGSARVDAIMPATWLELSVRHDLGIDPFDPHDNIMAGAAYLREMLDRFGSAGFLAAYNAGPKRYEEHLATGRALPDETRIYIARLASLIGIEQRNSGGSGARRFATWQQAPILVEGSESLFPDGNSASGVRTMNSSKAAPNAATTALVPRATGPFVRRSDGTKTAVSNPSVAFLRRRGWNRWSSTNAARDCSTTHKAICLHRRRANDDGGSCRAQGQARRARHGAGARLSLFAGAAWRERGFVRCQAHQSYR
ncbi:hypothetical protein ACVWZR_002363 [Bradyrhizobium sp. i1.3.1]